MIQQVMPFMYIFFLFFFGVSSIYALFYAAHVQKAKEELAIALPPPLIVVLTLSVLVTIISFCIVLFLILVG